MIWRHGDKFKGKATVIVASGPSLDIEKFPQSEDDINRVKQAKMDGLINLATVNDSCYLFDGLVDVLYAGDLRWWKHHITTLRGEVEHPIFKKKYDFSKAEMWTKETGAAQMYGLNLCKHDGTTGLGTEAGVIKHGGNSGYQLINLCYHFGANPIYLLGFDCKNMQQNKTHKNHFFGNHPVGWGNANGVMAWADYFKGLAKGLDKRGVEVINCTRDTAIRHFKRGIISEYL